MRAHSSDYRVIGLSLVRDGLREYIEKNRIEYPVYTSPDPEQSRDFISGGTPTTVLISAGAIEAVWRGAYAGKAKDEVEAKLRVRLPGVLPLEPLEQHRSQ